MARKKKRTNRFKKIWTNVFGSTFVAASMIFGLMIWKGTTLLLPDIAGGILIAVGIVGLAVLSYFGLTNK